MSAFDLGHSLLSAQRRFADADVDKNAKRSGLRDNLRRSNAHAQVHPEIEQLLQQQLQGREKPSVASLRREIAQLCAELGVAPPARETLHNAVAQARPLSYSMRALPHAVQQALYNLSATAEGVGGVPGDQVVFYCFNYGDVRAISYAAGMPWLCLVRAAARRGFRPKSLALLRAVMLARGL